MEHSPLFASSTGLGIVSLGSEAVHHFLRQGVQVGAVPRAQQEWECFPSSLCSPLLSPHSSTGEAGAGSRDRPGLEMPSAQRGSCSFCCPGGAVLELSWRSWGRQQGRWWHRAAKRLAQNSSAEQTSSTHCAAQSWPSTQITVMICDPQQNCPSSLIITFSLWSQFIRRASRTTSDSAEGVANWGVGEWPSEQRGGMRVCFPTAQRSSLGCISFLSLLPPQSNPQQRRMTTDMPGE